MHNCCETIVKYLLVILNLIFALTGLALVSLGAYVQIKAENLLDFLGDNYVNTPIFFMIIGVVIFIISFFGCCGAFSESPCMIYTYAFFLVFILIAELGAGIAAYMLKADVKKVLSTNMMLGMNNYNKTEYEGVTSTWDFVQRNFECCGVNASANWQQDNKTIPTSCCIENQEEGCQNNAENVYQIGCLSLLEEQFVGNIGIVGAVAFGVAFVQICGICFACFMAKRIEYGGSGEYV
jgi:CD63 antigen